MTTLSSRSSASIRRMIMLAPDLSASPLTGLLSLAGRRAVITGGGAGIGRAIAGRFAEAGASILIADIDQAAALRAAASIRAEHGVATSAVALDVAAPGAAAEAVLAAQRDLGGLEIWVNNAGICEPLPYAQIDAAQWDRTHHLDLRGAFLGAQAAANHLIAQGSAGVILNLASISAFRGRANHAHYVAAKHGVVGLTKSLATELGPHGIRVVAIAPTLVATEGQQRNAAAAAAQGNDLQTAIAASIPLGRIAIPDDVARVALFLVSDLAAFVTGSTVRVDGGASAS
jgi:NAD(P)-dependent dehydrogenase (short-subunit alcohol dehydrogenase family)